MTRATVLPDRLGRLMSPDVRLRDGPGAGANGTIDVCAMQAVAWLAGEPLTDRPACACPVIGRYVIRLNDSRLFRDHRDLLKPYCARIVGTRSTRDVEARRAFIAADYAVRAFAPAWLRALGRDEWAGELEAIPPIVDRDTARAARDGSAKVREAAYPPIVDRDTARAARDGSAKVREAAYAAAYAAADADADAYAAETAAVAAAETAAAAAAASPIIRLKALECLDAMIAVGA